VSDFITTVVIGTSTPQTHYLGVIEPPQFVLVTSWLAVEN